MSSAASDNSKTLSTITTTVETYLKSILDTGGSAYLKSRDIATETNLTTKQAANGLRALSERNAEPIDVEAWSYSNATTWLITLTK